MSATYAGVCVRCKRAIEGKLTLSDGAAPYALIGALCLCEERGIAVVLTVKK